MIINYLIKDIISYNKQTIYGVQGEQVVVINSQHYPVMIVETIKGNKFPCHIDYLSQTKVQKNETKSTDMVKTNRNRKR